MTVTPDSCRMIYRIVEMYFSGVVGNIMGVLVVVNILKIEIVQLERLQTFSLYCYSSKIYILFLHIYLFLIGFLDII